MDAAQMLQAPSSGAPLCVSPPSPGWGKAREEAGGSLQL